MTNPGTFPWATYQLWGLQSLGSLNGQKKEKKKKRQKAAPVTESERSWRYHKPPGDLPDGLAPALLGRIGDTLWGPMQQKNVWKMLRSSTKQWTKPGALLSKALCIPTKLASLLSETTSCDFSKTVHLGINSFNFARPGIVKCK